MNEYEINKSLNEARLRELQEGKVNKPSLTGEVSFYTPTEQTFEQKRFEAAKAAMTAQLVYSDDFIKEKLIETSIACADELLRQLGEK